MPGDGKVHQIPGELEKLPVLVIGVSRELLGQRVIPVVDVELRLPAASAEPELEILVAMRVEPDELVVRKPHALAESLRAAPF